jgi:outer membrane protein assembly factor BamB
VRRDAEDKAKAEQWARPMPIHVRAMVLAGKTLFAAGPEVDAQSGGFGKGAMLLAVSAADGAELARYPLDSAPVFDGMVAANGRLYISTVNGNLTCFGRRP